MPGCGDAAGPALTLQDVYIQCQEGASQTQVIDQVADVYHASGNALETGATAKAAQGRCGVIVEKVGEGRTANQVQKAAQDYGPDQADNGIVRARGHEQAGAQVGGPQ